MTDKRRRYKCKGCGLLVHLNRKGYCGCCAFDRSLQSIHDLQTKSGHFYEKWRAALLESLERGKK